MSESLFSVKETLVVPDCIHCKMYELPWVPEVFSLRTEDGNPSLCFGGRRPMA